MRDFEGILRAEQLRASRACDRSKDEEQLQVLSAVLVEDARVL